MECLDQCASMQNSTYLLEVTICVKKICEKMENWCSGEGLEEVYEEINNKYGSLQNADYIGKVTTIRSSFITNFQVPTPILMGRIFQKNSNSLFKTLSQTILTRVQLPPVTALTKLKLVMTHLMSQTQQLTHLEMKWMIRCQRVCVMIQSYG